MGRVYFEYGSARADLVPTDDVYVLMNVRSDKPRNGHGSGLMKAITDYADRHGIVIILEACESPHHLPELTKRTKELEDWYGRFGFTALPERSKRQNTLMCRNPSQEIQAL